MAAATAVTFCAGPLDGYLHLSNALTRPGARHLSGCALEMAPCPPIMGELITSSD